MKRYEKQILYQISTVLIPIRGNKSNSENEPEGIKYETSPFRTSPDFYQKAKV